MCYAIPAKILSINGEEATVDYGGVTKVINHTLVEDAKIDDYVLIHAGFAIEKIEQKSAKETIEIIKRGLEQFNEEDFSIKREFDERK